MTGKVTEIKAKYIERYDILLGMEGELERDIRENVDSCLHIDRVTARAKTISTFCQKAMKEEAGKFKYSDPLNQIQDQLGARIVTLYLQDLEIVSKKVEEYYRPIRKKEIVPESETEFGYEGKHYIFFIPEAILPKGDDYKGPKFFELQIRTVFQHAWSEAEHDLGYKATRTLSSREKRRLAFTAAQAWGADMIFSELFAKGKKKQ